MLFGTTLWYAVARTFSYLTLCACPFFSRFLSPARYKVHWCWCGWSHEESREPAHRNRWMQWLSLFLNGVLCDRYISGRVWKGDEPGFLHCAWRIIYLIHLTTLACDALFLNAGLSIEKAREKVSQWMMASLGSSFCHHRYCLLMKILFHSCASM